jgi:L,D-peptidoglycan transpeptidase YkuD (ErfK/YbiS/YcfS/YnhG family)
MKTRRNGPQAQSQLIVRALSAGAQRGVLACGPLCFPCAVGWSGRRAGKREGDGATPVGRFALREVFYRGDRLLRPRTQLPIAVLDPRDGWCDDPADRNYNRHVRHPYPASAERLWRADRLYDLIIVLGYNEVPRVRGRGSAIFMHVADLGMKPTAGCVALRLPHLLRLIERMPRGATITILPQQPARKWSPLADKKTARRREAPGRVWSTPRGRRTLGSL